MPSLKFKRLLILSRTEKLGAQYLFKSGLNLITAKDNSVGKSTLAKLLYWGMGCAPILDSYWTKLDCGTLLEFEVSGLEYSVMRFEDSISFKQGEDAPVSYDKITGAYAEVIANLVGFHVLLPNKQSLALEVPPPAYYFLPFYVDQKLGWGNPWHGFEYLQQYANWQQSVIKYHVGLLTPEYFANEKIINDNKLLQKKLESEVGKLNDAFNFVQPYINKAIIAIEQDEFERIKREIEIDLANLGMEQEKLLDSLSKAESEKANLFHQAEMIKSALVELDKDYQFAVENIPDGNFECPLCGTHHDNTVVARSAILADRNEAALQLNDVEVMLDVFTIKISRLQFDVEEVRNNISALNDKYMLDDDGVKLPLTSIVNSIAAKSIQSDVSVNKAAKAASIKDTKANVRRLVQERKKILSEERIDAVNKFFLEKLASYIKILDAEAVDMSLIKSPTSYRSIFKEGGAAEGTRTILAYYLAVYSTISEYGSEAVPGMVIDTPNQQEQSAANYQRIVNLLTENLPSDSQIIICALDRVAIAPIKEKAHIINLDKSKLLNQTEYDMVKPLFGAMGATV